MQNRELLALPDWSAVPSNSAEDCRLLNGRIAYFGAVMACLSLAFYLFNFLVLGLQQPGWVAYLAAPTQLLHAGAIAMFGSAWLLCKSGRRPSEQLNLIDVGTLVVSIGLFAWKGVLEDGGFLQAVVTVMTSLAIIVTHAIMVPATARRGFWVSTLAASPATIAAYCIGAQLAARDASVTLGTIAFGTAYIGMWSGLSVAVATLASRVIYGLRQRAREAREIGQYTLEAKLGAGRHGRRLPGASQPGLVKEPTLAGDPTQTDASALLGTPNYMAPEAILDPARVGAAADIYSVGAVAFFLLVGEPVFVGSTTMEVCLKQVHEPPEPPSTRARQAVPSELDELVLCCLDKRPEARPASASALRARLAELQTQLAWSAGDADAWWRQASGEVIAASRAALATPDPNAGMATLAIDWAERRAPPARDRKPPS